MSFQPAQPFPSRQPRVILLTFMRPDCPHCQAQEPILQQVEQIMQGLVRFERRNIYEDRATAQAWGVNAAPTHFLCLAVPNNQPAQVLQKLVGKQDITTLINVIQSALMS